MNKRLIREELKDRGVQMLIANMIVQAFDDLYAKHKKIEEASSRVKDKNRWLKEVNYKIDHNKASAQVFFKSPLFLATGLSFEYLNRKYLEDGFKEKNLN